MANQPVSIPMTLSDHWPGFQGHGILTSRISKKNVRHRDKVTAEK